MTDSATSTTGGHGAGFLQMGGHCPRVDGIPANGSLSVLLDSKLYKLHS